MTSRKTVTCHQIILITGLPRSGRVCKTVYVFTTTSTRSDARKGMHTYRTKERTFSNQLCSEETVQHGKSQTKKCRCNTKISKHFLIARSFLENFVDYIHTKALETAHRCWSFARHRSGRTCLSISVSSPRAP